jgi:hypothetical protein
MQLLAFYSNTFDLLCLLPFSHSHGEIHPRFTQPKRGYKSEVFTSWIGVIKRVAVKQIFTNTAYPRAGT